MVEVRRLTAEYSQAIYAIEQVAHSHPWSKAIVRETLAQDYLVWGVFVKHTLCGFAVAQQVLDEVQILNICTHPDYQRQGLASTLLTAVLQQICVKGVAVFLEVRVSNQAAQKLYQQFGFVQIGLRKQYYPSTQASREDAVVMRHQCVVD